MSAENPFRTLVAGFADLLARGSAVPPPPVPDLPACPDAGTGTVLLFSPHPDDECITGALPLRLGRELKMTICNVAMTLGSNEAARARRWGELRNACAYLGFRLRLPVADGFAGLHPRMGETSPEAWAAAVAVVAQLLADEEPEIIFLPHALDRHRTHIAVHALVSAALAALPSSFRTLVVETEYWAAMAEPNLMVVSSIEDVADLVAALSLHVGEVARTPYHLTLPAWMIDNVRRGGELIDGWHASAPPHAFATLYRASPWPGREVRAAAAAATPGLVATTADLAAWRAEPAG